LAAADADARPTLHSIHLVSTFIVSQTAGGFACDNTITEIAW